MLQQDTHMIDRNKDLRTGIAVLVITAGLLIVSLISAIHFAGYSAPSEPKITGQSAILHLPYWCIIDSRTTSRDNVLIDQWNGKNIELDPSI